MLYTQTAPADQVPLKCMFRTTRNATTVPPPLPTQISRESDVLRALDTAIRERLPDGWDMSLAAGQRVGRSIADAVLTVTAPDGTRGAAAVEARLRVDGRDLDKVLAQARMLTVDLPADGPERGPPIVAARFLSRRIRDELATRGVNYADASGNIRIALARPGLYISDSGADRDPVPDRRRLRSLAGDAAARVVIALFDVDPPVKVRELAERSGTSLGTISRVFELLEREAVVERGEGGTIVSVDRARLIERWTEDYSFTQSNTTSLFLEPRNIERLLKRLRAAPFRYAVTGSLAARQIAEFAEAKLAMVYVDDIDRAAADLGLVPVEGGGNVLLAEPSDRSVFENTWERDGISYAAVAQVAADLLTAPGRGPAEGEELLRVAAAGKRDG